MEETRKELMDAYRFGRALFNAGDLDPVYVAVWNARLGPDALRRWLLAYWCFYHVGTASWAVDGGDGYWDRMATAAASKDYPRCHERRHFRGRKAIGAVSWLAERGMGFVFDDFDRAAAEGRTMTAAEVAEYARSWPQFGPWIAFKVADMLERLDLCRVSFDAAEIGLYESPRKGAELLWLSENGPLNPAPKNVGEWAINRLMEKLGREKAPPRYERLINPQEAETVLCKWHSYEGGHYEIGEDVEATRKGLLRFGRCPTAQRLLAGGREGGIW